MSKILLNAIVLLIAVVTIAESRIQLQRGLLNNEDIESAYQPYPYIFPHSPRVRSVNHRGFDIADEDVEYDEDAILDNEKLLENEDMLQMAAIKPEAQKKPLNINKLSWSSDKSGSILVPDGIIEVEGQTVYDEKTGKATLLVAKEALDAIPNGSIVALLDTARPLNNSDEDAEERANRVLVRRRKKDSRINIRGGSNKRRRSGNNNIRNNKRRRTNNRSRRPTVQVWNPNTLNNRRRRTNARPSSVVPIIVRG